MPVCKIPKTCNLTSVKWWFSSNRTWQPAHLRRFTHVFSQTVRKLPEQRVTEISKSRQHIGLNVKLGLYEVFIKRNNAFSLNCSFFLLIETDYSAKSGLMLIHGNSSLWKSFHLCTLYASEKSIWYHSESFIYLLFQRLLLLIDTIIVVRMLSH